MTVRPPVQPAPGTVQALFASLGGDPYVFIAPLHAQGPVLRTPMFAVVVGHGLATAVLKDHEHFSSDPSVGTASPLGTLPIGTIGSLLGGKSMLSSDPPDHERLRGVVARAFTPRSVIELEPRVRAIAAELVEPLVAGEPYEVIGRFAEPLPVIVIAELLGIPAGERELFKAWSDGLLSLNDPARSQAGFEAVTDSVRDLSAYFLDVIDERRRAPRDDLISRLVEANEGGILSKDELVRQCILLLVAGNETTTHLIGNAVHTLSQHPDERRRLAGDPSIIANAVDEVMRFNCVVIGTARVAHGSTELQGERFDDGQLVFVFIAAANRDPKTFERPDAFDVARSNAAKNLGFGGGIHYCLGAALARQETRIALETLMRAAPQFELADPAPPVEYTLFLRGPKRLDIVASA